MLVTIHSIWRWVVVVMAVAAIVGVSSARSSRPATWAVASGLLYTVALDFQVLIGLVLWLGTGAWAQNPFIGFIHPLMMLAGLGVAHMARGRSKKGAATGTVIGMYGASLAILALAIPTYAWHF